LLEMSALVAPRPLLIASAGLDGIFTIAAIEEFYARLKGLYRHLGRPDDIDLVTFAGPHSYHEATRTGIFSWFVRHLQGGAATPATVGDIDGVRESAADLAVFKGGPPANDTATTVQDWFVEPAPPPVIEDAAQLAERRGQIVQALRATSFNALPERPAPPDVAIHQRWAERGGTQGVRFSFASEGWRLHGSLHLPPNVSTPAPVAIALQNPGDGRAQSLRILDGLRSDWLRARIEPRGTGETAWGSELSWHVRRAAALMGRTIASMRVADVLAGLAAVRSLDETAGRPVALAAEGEMAAVAIFAALLDGNVQALILKAPPETLDAPSRPDGTGPAVELMGALRHVDLPQAAGLLWPARLIFVQPRPASYLWCERLYARLGAPGGTWRVKSLAEVAQCFEG
ncbi:MAG TPA: hypothetical protein VFK80_06115, partial [Limnochordia bacterium]|nr:hypothetical protein [Limnochordia bacterium]